MNSNVRKKLLEREMTRKEFLQFTGSSLVILFGLTNLVALLGHFNKTATQPKEIASDLRHGFGSRKFGV